MEGISKRWPEQERRDLTPRAGRKAWFASKPYWRRKEKMQPSQDMRIVDIEAETPKNRFKKASTTSPAILFCLP
jgi:hypothetical protein